MQPLVPQLPIHPHFLVLDIHSYDLFPSSTIHFQISPLQAIHCFLRIIQFVDSIQDWCSQQMDLQAFPMSLELGCTWTKLQEPHFTKKKSECMKMSRWGFKPASHAPQGLEPNFIAKGKGPLFANYILKAYKEQDPGMLKKKGTPLGTLFPLECHGALSLISGGEGSHWLE